MVDDFTSYEEQAGDQSRAAFYPSSNMPDSRTPAEPVLREPLPLVKPLSLEEIMQVASIGLGLRNTDGANLDMEMREGLSGDFITISDLSAFLKLKENSKFAEIARIYKIDGVSRAVRLGKFTELDGLRELPEKFDEELYGFIQDSLEFRYHLGTGKELNENVLVREYVGQILPGAVPAFELISDPGLTTGRDKERYHLFGKAGTQVLEPERILASAKLTQKDFDLLQERYGDYLGKPVTTEIMKNGKPVRLGSMIGDDVSEVIMGKVVGMIRAKI